jgi:hypothetical protein
MEYDPDLALEASFLGRPASYWIALQEQAQMGGYEYLVDELSRVRMEVERASVEVRRRMALLQSIANGRKADGDV